MHKSSSGRIFQNNDEDESHPPSGFYPSDCSDSSSVQTKATFKCTTVKKSVIGENLEPTVDDVDYDSADDLCYQVTFPTVELAMPRHRHRHRRHRSRRTTSSGGPAEEYVTVTKHVDRRRVYGESDCQDSISEPSSYTYSTNPDRSSSLHSIPRSTVSHGSGGPSTDGTYRTFNSTHRLQSLGNFFTGIIDFFRSNPKFSKILFGMILCYVAVCNLEILIPRVIALFVRLCYPWARYSAVICEQFFSTIANMFTRMDAVIFASYCEFAAKYCRSRRLMCDVTCSFVDHVLSQARPTLQPIPQN